MSNSIRSLLNPFLEVLFDLKFFRIEFSISVKQIRTPTSLNVFSIIQTRNPRKRTQNYVSSQTESKRTRTLLIWTHEKEMILENGSDIRRYWKCNICQEWYISTLTTSSKEHLRKKHDIRLNNETSFLSQLSIINQQRQFIKI